MELTFDRHSWSLRCDGQIIIEHGPARPCCYVGFGRPSIAMLHGHSHIEDFVEERVALRHAQVHTREHGQQRPVAASVRLPQLTPLEYDRGHRVRRYSCRIASIG
jgi:hypothetical protein